MITRMLDTTAGYHPGAHKQLNLREVWKIKGFRRGWRSLRESNPSFQIEKPAKVQ